MSDIKIKDYAKRLAIKDKSFAEQTKTQITTLNTKVDTNKTNTDAIIGANKLDADNTKTLANANATLSASNKARLDAAETRLTNTEAVANIAKSQSDDYVSNKSKFALLEDIQGEYNIDLDLAIPSAVSGTITIPTTALASIPTGANVEYIFSKTGSASYIAKDSFDSNGTSNNFGGENFGFKATSTEITLENVSAALETLLSGYKIVRASYYGTSGGSIDQVARDAASVADTKATSADAKANTNKTDIATLTTRVSTTEGVANAAKAQSDTNKTNLDAEIARATAAEQANATAIGNKQSSTDNGLTTTAKQIVPAINEINASKLNATKGAQTTQTLVGYGLAGESIEVPVSKFAATDDIAALEGKDLTVKNGKLVAKGWVEVPVAERDKYDYSNVDKIKVEYNIQQPGSNSFKYGFILNRQNNNNASKTLDFIGNLSFYDRAFFVTKFGEADSQRAINWNINNISDTNKINYSFNYISTSSGNIFITTQKPLENNVKLYVWI